MIVTVAFAAAVASVPLLGGDLTRLSELRFRAAWTIAVALALQILVISVLEDDLPMAVAAGLHLLSYGLGIAFILANRHVRGMTVLIVGGLLNLVAIGANGGVMPATEAALDTAGISYETGDFENSGPVEDAAFWYLGDVFAVPAGVPLANVFSVGDVLLVIGGGVVVHTVSGSRIAHRRLTADPL